MAIDFSKIKLGAPTPRVDLKAAEHFYEDYRKCNGTDGKLLYDCIYWLHRVDDTVDVSAYEFLNDTDEFSKEAFLFARDKLKELKERYSL